MKSFFIINRVIIKIVIKRFQSEEVVLWLKKMKLADYGKVTGMVHSTESFGKGRWTWYPFYCLFADAICASVLP